MVMKSKAFIACAGHARRLGPFCYQIPKCMLNVNGRPCLQHIIEDYRDSDIVPMTIGLSKNQAPSVIARFGDGTRLRTRIFYSIETSANGSAISLRHAWHLLDDRCHLAFCDVLTRFNIRSLEQWPISILICRSSEPERCGNVIIDGDRVVAFKEKPQHPDGSLVFAGRMWFIKSAIFTAMSEPGAIDLSRDVLARVTLHAVTTENIIDVGTTRGFLNAAQWSDHYVMPWPKGSLGKPSLPVHVPQNVRKEMQAAVPVPQVDRADTSRPCRSVYH